MGIISTEVEFKAMRLSEITKRLAKIKNMDNTNTDRRLRKCTFSYALHLNQDKPFWKAVAHNLNMSIFFTEV